MFKSVTGHFETIVHFRVPPLILKVLESSSSKNSLNDCFVIDFSQFVNGVSHGLKRFSVKVLSFWSIRSRGVTHNDE